MTRVGGGDPAGEKSRTFGRALDQVSRDVGSDGDVTWEIWFAVARVKP